jgi:mono/diheme cytochrome c family protein
MAVRYLRIGLAGLLALCTGPALTASLPPIPSASRPRVDSLSPEQGRKLIVDDWIKQASATGTAVTTESDARGGCDGIKDGKYAFHTVEEPNPWWQVNLGRKVPIQRIVVYNRLDYAPGLHNADTLQILTSDDGRQWSLIHDNKGKHFGGVQGAPPLDVRFPEDQVAARFVRFQIPSRRNIYLHLDEVEIYGSDPAENLALHRAANQSSISQWSTAKPMQGPLVSYPVKAVIKSARKLAAHLSRQGVDCSQTLRDLDAVASAAAALPENPPGDEVRSLYLKTRWIVRELVFSNPLLDFNELLFVKRFTQETYPDICLNHMPWVSRPGGDLCVLSAPERGSLASLLRSGSSEKPRPQASLLVRSILNGALGPGHVHGMDLWWDGSRIVFGYARAATDQPPEGWMDRSRSYHLRRTVEPIHIYEVDTTGNNLRQLTFGEWSDLDPTYTPSGDIVFVSERCGTSLQCNEYDKDETSCNLYTMRPDGSGIRRLSVNKDGDYLPHTLDDGTIGYVRWEYHERSWAFIQSVWTIHPDGTFADAVFKQHFTNPWALEDTRSIPGSKKLVSIAAGHHTLAVGPIVVLDVSRGVNDPSGISIVTPQVKPTEGGMDGVVVSEGGTRDGSGLYSTPWALSEKFFLASYTYSNRETDAKGYGLYLVDVFGNKELIYRDPQISSFMPIPLRSRPLPPVLPELVELEKTATCILSDATFGSEELAGRARFLRIAEPIGWPYDNQLGGQRYGEKGPNLINWTPVRILGDLPLEADGSAHFEVPADTAVYFQLLDENRMELRRMRSFISFQPGEKRLCAGCHETRGVSPRPSVLPLAATRPPQALIAPPWGAKPVSFLRDIQPILDRNCVACHTGLKPSGGVDFSAGLTDWSGGTIPGYGFNRAFETINRSGLAAVAEPNIQDSSITPSMAYGAHRSKLMAAIDSKSHRERVSLTPDERLRLTMWIDANAPYHDRFVNKRAAQPAYDIAGDRHLAAEIKAVHARRCVECHKPQDISRVDWIDLRHPERSLFLHAPLGGETKAGRKCNPAVYPDTNDPDYKSLLDLVTKAAQEAWKKPRRDLQAIMKEAAFAEAR